MTVTVQRVTPVRHSRGTRVQSAIARRPRYRAASWTTGTTGSPVSWARFRAENIGPSGGLEGRKLSEAQAARNVVVNRLHAAAHEVRLVPEAGSARRPKEVSPPFAMGRRTGPRLKCIEV